MSQSLSIVPYVQSMSPCRMSDFWTVNMSDLRRTRSVMSEGPICGVSFRMVHRSLDRNSGKLSESGPIMLVRKLVR